MSTSAIQPPALLHPLWPALTDAGAPGSDHTAELDRMVHAALAKFTGNISPASLQMAFTDWLTHLAHNPAQLQEILGNNTMRHAVRLAQYAASLPGCDRASGAGCVEPPEHDDRFRDPAWQTWPFNVWHQSFLTSEKWWQEATTGVRGVSRHHQDVVSFTTRQILDMFSPTNYPLTNPVVLAKTLSSGGTNLYQGALNWFDDAQRIMTHKAPAGTEQFVVGKNLAATPGQVVFRNDLIELIQYTPTTETVYPEPILIVPAWIMKYYILDLSAHNSMIAYLVRQGHTVFTLSWKNPGPADRNIGMEDYLRLGLMDSLDVVSAIVPDHKIHAVGYCLGGTLLSIGAAAMARDGDERLASATLFAAQTDFTEPGELGLFIDDSQLSLLEDVMWDKGVLDASQMAGAFQLLRSYDLIWSRMVHEYMMGERAPMIDLMAWNSDTTRMPYRMHAEYLRNLFLNNELAREHLNIGGKPVALNDIRIPVFMVGTSTDHVAPWRSVYKLHGMTDAEITFVLTAGGHNAGIVNEPGHPHRSYRIQTRAAEGQYVDPDSWLTTAQKVEGSWWPAWEYWLAHYSGARVAPPAMGAAAKGYAVLYPAPGTYVMQR